MKKYQLLVIHIVDDQELKPKPWGDVALIDVENGRERKFFLDEDLVRRFQRNWTDYFTEIETVCAGRRIDYLRTTTQMPFDEFVLPDAAASEQRDVNLWFGPVPYALLLFFSPGCAAHSLSP